MDVNGTRFQLLLGHRDWARCEDEDGHALKALWRGNVPGVSPHVAWDHRRAELTLLPDVLRFEAAPLDRPPRLADRRGAGRDRFGSWYWIAPGARGVLVRSAGTGTTSAFWPAEAGAPAPAPAPAGAFGPAQPGPPPPPRRLAGAAVTEDHFLVVGTLDPPGVLVLDLQAGGAPSELPWPPGSEFAPFDMAPRAGGGVFILDAEHRRVWELDRHFRVIPAAPAPPAAPAEGGFAPVDAAAPAPGAGAPAALGPADATALAGDPVAIEPAPGGGVLVLERGDARGSLVTLYRDGVATGAPARTADASLALHITGHDMALCGDTLYVADAGGNQAYAFALAIDADGDVALSLAAAYYPMRRFAGKGLVAADGEPYYDFEDGWIPLVHQPRARYREHATVVTPVLDAGEPGCVWHRVMLDACLPTGTSVAVWSQAADERAELAVAGWRREPAPRLRRSGPELPFAARGPYDTYELLLQRATGRHLRLRLQLRGDGRATPRVRALRAWYPRFSYLERYLPGAYRAEPDSASFLDRFLANVEGLYTAIEDRVGAAQVLLGADTAPAETLDWLASWFDLALDPLWDERRRRLLLRNATRFFQARGTIRGVELALRLTLDRCVPEGVLDERRPPALRGVRIVEAYRTRSTPGVIFGDPSELEGPRSVITTARWRPEHGRDALQAGYAAHLDSRGLSGTEYPVVDPGGSHGAAWREFSRAVLGFVPARPDAARWRSYLARRYANEQALARAWGERATEIAALEPPARLPADGAALVDWYQFQAVALAMAAKAHRFTVLLPWPLHVPDSRGAELDQEQLRALARRVVELQQPAHTIFTVKFFWAAFRIGEARLGDDTLLASGSRAPELLQPAVLGRDHLGESYLAGAVASDVIARAPLSATTEGPSSPEEST